MSKTRPFDMDKYRTKLERMDDEQLFDEQELEELAETQRAAFVEDYQSQLEGWNLADLFSEEEWEKIRAAKIEERINEQLQTLEQLGE